MRCGRLDCQQYPRLCRDAGVRAYPTLKLYQGGGRLDMVGTEVDSLQPEPIVQAVRHRLKLWAAQGEPAAGPAVRDEL